IQKKHTESLKLLIWALLGFFYESLSQKNKENRDIFLRDINIIFYNLISYQDNKEMYDIIFDSLYNDYQFFIVHEIVENEDIFHKETLKSFLYAINDMLKGAFDEYSRDKEPFFVLCKFIEKILKIKKLHIDNQDKLKSVIIDELSVIFGFCAWIYEKNKKNSWKDEDFIDKLISLLKNRTIEEYISIYINAIRISREDRIGWSFWDHENDGPFMITIENSMRDLFVDLLILFLSEKGDTFEVNSINLKDDNILEEFVYMVKDATKDPFKNRGLGDYFFSKKMEEKEFSGLKDKIYLMFEKFKTDYNKKEKEKIIEEKLDTSKCASFAENNEKSYKDSLVMSRIIKFNDKDLKVKKTGIGHRRILYKDEFIKDSRTIYTNDNEFGFGIGVFENNEIINKIKEKYIAKIISIKSSEIFDKVLDESEFDSVVLWTDNYIDLDSYNNRYFKAHYVLDENKKGGFYLGKIKNRDVYSVYKNDGQYKGDDFMFLFKKDCIEIEKFIPDLGTKEIGDNLFTATFSDPSLGMSIENISQSEERLIELANALHKDMTPEEKHEKIMELRTKVIFKFIKGIDLDSLKSISECVKIFKIN
ncbi:MAG: hypothetical protein PHQ01_04185, partial [Candidatus Pacebacteria bacterium]|nr:hypothetical protein [Candidatus Paceibacterota bacterium]